MTPPNRFPELLTYHRTRAGLSKGELARRIGVSDVSIGYWETGVTVQIGHLRLLSLAAALGIAASELIGDPMLSMRFIPRTEGDEGATPTKRIEP